MRHIVHKPLLIMILFVLGAAGNAQADSKILLNTFWPLGHSEAQDLQPYIDPPLIQHNLRYKRENWQPQHWTAPNQDAQDVVQSLFDSGVLVERGEDCDDIPVLEVGEAFLHLSAREQIRIARLIDYAYGMTNTGGMYYLTYRSSCQKIGVFTTRGLHMH